MPASTGNPRRLGSYEIVERLATGGMAEIFLACQRASRGLERLVVIKRILPHLAMQPAFVEMFVQEARIVARLSHPNVVQIHDLAEADGEVFIVMEYVPGSSLRQLLDAAEDAGSPVPVGVAVAILAQACRGAHAAHELRDGHGRPLGLVHRDVSPHNLMVTPEGHVKLLDFGIAKATESIEATNTGSLKGKYCYMSPEQCEHRALDRRSDVFALAIVGWEMLTGKRLYKRDSELASMQAIVNEDAPLVSVDRPEVPVGVAEALARALRREKDERTATADDLRRELVDACEAAGIPPRDDAVAAYVHGLLGALHERRRAEVDAAVEGTLAHTPSTSGGGGAGGLGAAEAATRGSDDVATAVARRPARIHTQTVSTDVSPRRARARALMVSASAAVAGAVAAFGALLYFVGPITTPQRVLTGPPVILGFPPVVAAEIQQRELEPLRIHMERAFNRPVQFPVTASYEELADRVAGGNWQFGSFPPYLYVKTRARDPRLKPLAFKLFEGSSGTDGVLLVRDGVPVNSIKDTAGRTFCFTDPNSLTGYVMPRAALKRAGLDPDVATARHVFSGEHMQVMRDLIDGRCDVGATFSGAYVTSAMAGVKAGGLRMVTVTGRSPQDAIAAGPGATPAEVATMTRALLSFDPRIHADAGMLGEVHRITGFVVAEDGAYAELRGVLEAAGAPH